MRYNDEHKSQTRARILAEAARSIRATGVRGVSVKTMMDGAGLTHGGFYSHFVSKDDLVAHAIDHMFQERADLVPARSGKKAPAEVLTRFIDSYLSMRHRERTDVGCPIPALATDIPHLSPAARKRLARGVDDLRRSIEELCERLGRREPRNDAAFIVSSMVGAIVTSRIEPKAAAARNILAAARASLKEHMALGCLQPMQRNDARRGSRAPAEVL